MIPYQTGIMIASNKFVFYKANEIMDRYSNQSSFLISYKKRLRICKKNDDTSTCNDWKVKSMITNPKTGYYFADSNGTSVL